MPVAACETDGVPDGVGVSVCEIDGDEEADGEPDALGVPELVGVDEADGVAVGDGEADGDRVPVTEGDCERVAEPDRVCV